MIFLLPWVLNLEAQPDPGGPGDTKFQVYRSDDDGPIDYGTPVATVDGLTWTSPPLGFPGVWSFAVRAFNDYGEEKNLDCLATIRLDAQGVDISGRPAAPGWLTASAEAGGAVRLRFRPAGLDADAPSGPPIEFRVYHGVGAVDYGTVAAVVPAMGAVAHVAVLEGLPHGALRLFAVRAWSAFGESEPAVVACRPDSVGPGSVENFAIEAVV